MTRLYKRLVIRLMPVRLLDAMHVVYEECAQSCNARTNTPFIHPIETFAEWLCAAHETGWRPPSRIVPYELNGTGLAIDDGLSPSWLPEPEWPLAENS